MMNSLAVSYPTNSKVDVLGLDNNVATRLLTSSGLGFRFSSPRSLSNSLRCRFWSRATAIETVAVDSGRPGLKTCRVRTPRGESDRNRGYPFVVYFARLDAKDANYRIRFERISSNSTRPTI